MPFIITALYGDVPISHFGSLRIRAVGTGNLKTTLFTGDNVRNTPLANLALTSTDNKQKSLLSNLTAQKIKIKFYTDSIDEVFNITRVILFTKPTLTQLPQ